MLWECLGPAGLVLLALAPAVPQDAADARPGSGVGVEAARPAQQPPPPPKKRFEETIEVVAPGAAPPASPAELPVRPLAVMAVAGAAENVFRTLHTLPGIAATTEFDSRIAVRGGSPDENLTLLDGVEIHNPYRLFGLTSAFNPETVSRFDLHAGAFSAKYGDRLSSLLVVENRPGSDDGRFGGSTALSLTDANAVFEGRLPGEGSGSWIVAARRTYYDLVANSLVDTELPAFGDLQARLDWTPSRKTRLSLFGLLSREATDAFLEDDRPGEQLALVTSARNDLVALELRTPLGPLSSRTILSAYVNRDRIDADAQLRNEARRSNAPSDEIGFGLSDVDFARELEVRDLALRHELGFPTGRHLLESGFELHRLRTTTRWRIDGDRNPGAANGSSVQGGAGLPSELDSSVDSTRLGAWLMDSWQASPSVSLEAGLRLDWSGVNRRSTLSPRLAASWRLGGATRLRAGGGLFTQSPGYEKLVQSDYFVDLSGELGRSLRHERAVHVVLGLERELAPGLSARVEGYWKGLDQLVIGRLESEAERLARVARYDFPPELGTSVPAAPIITSFPVNAASGRSWGFDVLVQKRPVPGARLTGWASYTWGRATRDQYGREVAFDYDRRHAASVVASWRVHPKWELAATARVSSGFPRTPVLGLRVAAAESALGRLIPARDAEARYVYETDRGDVSNLNTERLPTFFRLDLRLTWKPRGEDGRWLIYLDVINATNRENAGQLEPRLVHDPASPLDRPGLLLERSAAIPLLPSVGVRFRF